MMTANPERPETARHRRWRRTRDAIDIASAGSLIALLVALVVLLLSMAIMPFSKAAGLYVFMAGMIVGSLGGIGACISLIARGIHPICPPGNGGT